MRRRRHDAEWTAEDDGPRSRRQRQRLAGRKRIALLLIPALMIESLVVVVLRPEQRAEALGTTKIVELDVVEPEPPALPKPVAKRKAKKKTRQTRKKKRASRRARRAARRAPEVAPRVTPPKPAAAPDPPSRPTPSLLRMRTSPSKNGTLAVPAPPASRTDTLRVGRHKIQRRRYADGGRLLSNRSRARVAAPERPGHWRTGKAPKGDAARLTLAGLASIGGGGRYGKVCDHFKRFPVAGKSRTVHLLIDSSPSMNDKMSPAETCAIGVANSALKKGYAVAIGRFGSSTVCHQATKSDARLRDIILDRRRMGGTRVPTTCGAKRAKTPVDVVVISDGGFFGSFMGNMLEARQVVSKPQNRGLLYIVPDPRFGANKRILAAYRASGFRVVHFGATARRRARVRKYQSDGG